MKLARFLHDGKAHIGVIRGDDIFDITAQQPDAIADMVELISAGPDMLAKAAQLAERAPAIALTQVHLLAPIARPGKIMAIGRNYADHAAELGNDLPTKQLWFNKLPSAVNGPYDPIVLPRVSDFVDYEVELVAIIGAAGKHISAADAPGHVMGYCVGNDVTARDWQKRTSQWTLGKSFDTHAPFGPWITTADEVADPMALEISLSVNGETRQSASTAQMVFSIWEQIAELSSVMQLAPGDIIFTGTPAGVGAGMSPKQALQPGDIVRAQIDGLGHIEARCETET